MALLTAELDFGSTLVGAFCMVSHLLISFPNWPASALPYMAKASEALWFLAGKMTLPPALNFLRMFQ